MANSKLFSSEQEIQEAHIQLKKLKEMQRKRRVRLERLQPLAGQLAKARKRLELEARDVEELEGPGLERFFSWLLGQLKTELNRERQEYLEARLEFEEIQDAVDFLNGELESLDEKIAQIQDPQARIEIIIAEKIQALKELSSPVADKLLEKSEDIAKLRVRAEELEEAIAIGIQADLLFRKSARSLRLAYGAEIPDEGIKRSWSTDVNDFVDAFQYFREADKECHRFDQFFYGDADGVAESIQFVDDKPRQTLFSPSRGLAGILFGVEEWLIRSKIRKAHSNIVASAKLLTKARADCQSELDRTTQKLTRLLKQRRILLETSEPGFPSN